MGRRVRWASRWLVAAAAVALAGSPALADHLSLYVDDPVEHDDLGRSDEPDHLVTGLFGIPLANAVADLDLDRYADVPTPAQHAGKDRRIAPGCTDAAGERVTSGLCGLHTIGVVDTLPPVVVEQGNCPGRYGGDLIVLFDARADASLYVWAGHPWIYDLNHKIADADAGVGGLLSQAGAKPLLLGPTSFWAWYGLWQDLNCNGVIDHLQANEANVATPDADNEFTWLGSCLYFNGDGDLVPNSNAMAGGYCTEDPNQNSNPPGQPGAARTTLTAYIWPGNFPSSSSPDIPGNLPPLPGGGRLLPLFNDQPYSLAPDLVGVDRTGMGPPEDRHWALGSADAGIFDQQNGQPSWLYDQSLFITTTVVTGVNCRANPNIAARFELGATGGPGSACAFLDVDRYASYSPLVGQLLEGLKPIAFGLWNSVAGIVNDIYSNNGPVSRLVQQLTGRNVYDNALGPQQGLLKQLFLDPGWSREPNLGPTLLPTGASVQDAYLGVRHVSGCDLNPGLYDSEEEFRGWCNEATSGSEGNAYERYQGQDFRGWIDLKAAKAAAWVPGWSILPAEDLFIPPQFQDWFFNDFGWAPLPPGDAPLTPEEHTRTLDPGLWYFQGWMGRWRDAVQVRDESVWPSPAPAAPCPQAPSQAGCKAYPKDGWIGFVSNNRQEYQGYLPELCTTEQGPGPHAWAECNPYVDGNVIEPQGYVDTGTEPPCEPLGPLGESNQVACLFNNPPQPLLTVEWQPACLVKVGDVVRVYPGDGVWSIPVLVVRNVRHASGSVLGDIETYLPGDTDVLELQLDPVCRSTSRFWTQDMLLLPRGSSGERILTVYEGEVKATVGGGEALDPTTDIDRYGSALAP